MARPVRITRAHKHPMARKQGQASQLTKKQWTSKVHRGQRKRPFPQNKQNSKSQIQGPKLPEGAVRVKFKTGQDIKEVYAYPEMPRCGNPKIPTLYEVMTDDLEVWESSE